MHIFTSKINWVALLTVVLGGLTALQTVPMSEQSMGILMGVIGVVTFVLRTYFSSPLK